jgi:hypothetical protein
MKRSTNASKQYLKLDTSISVLVFLLYRFNRNSDEELRRWVPPNTCTIGAVRRDNNLLMADCIERAQRAWCCLFCTYRPNRPLPRPRPLPLNEPFASSIKKSSTNLCDRAYQPARRYQGAAPATILSVQKDHTVHEGGIWSLRCLHIEDLVVVCCSICSRVSLEGFVAVLMPLQSHACMCPKHSMLGDDKRHVPNMEA